MWNLLFKKSTQSKSNQIYELILDKSYLFTWKNNDLLFCIQRKMTGKVTLIEKMGGNIFYRCTFEVHGISTYCDLPIMPQTFVPIEYKDKCLEYYEKNHKYPVINVLE